MAFGRKKNSGLDLGGVGKRRLAVKGGTLKSSKQGLAFASKRSAGGGNRRGSSPKGRFRPLLVVLFIVAALVVAIGVGYAVYMHTVESSIKPELDESTLNSALTKEDEDATLFWSLLVKTDATSAEKERGSVSQLALIAIDGENKRASVLWIEPSMDIYVAGYGYHSCSEAFDLGQETTIVSALENLAGIKINHYFEVNETGWEKTVESLGFSVAKSPSKDVEKMANKILGSSSEQIGTYSQELLEYIASDLDEDELSALISNVQGIDTSSDFTQATMPVEEEQTATTQRKVADADQWATIFERIESGMAPLVTDSELQKYEALCASYKITIWNGVGVSGVAADCANALEAKGWTIRETTNAASYVYEETLIVYKNDSDEEVANLLAADLGQGRVVPSAARYSFKGNILVVVGSDYQLN